VSYLAKGNKHLLLGRPYSVIRVEPKTSLQQQQQLINTVTTTTTNSYSDYNNYTMLSTTHKLVF